MNEPINFFSEGTKFRLQKKRVLRSWIGEAISEEKKISGDINFIFCKDEYLLKMNRKYLKNNMLTDVLTFSMVEEETMVSGDIYLSIDRIKENSKEFKQPFLKEILRVMIHGVLHLMEYRDESDEERKVMRMRENNYLKRILPAFENTSLRAQNI